MILKTLEMKNQNTYLLSALSLRKNSYPQSVFKESSDMDATVVIPARHLFM